MINCNKCVLPFYLPLPNLSFLSSTETNRLLTTLIAKVAEKQDMHSSIVANYIRTKLSFEIVKSQVLCIRGSRKMKKPFVDVGEVEVVQHVAGIRE